MVDYVKLLEILNKGLKNPKFCTLLYVGCVLLDELAEFNLEVVKGVSIFETLRAMITYSAVQSSIHSAI